MLTPGSESGLPQRSGQRWTAGGRQLGWPDSPAWPWAERV